MLLFPFGAGQSLPTTNKKMTSPIATQKNQSFLFIYLFLSLCRDHPEKHPNSTKPFPVTDGIHDPQAYKEVTIYSVQNFLMYVVTSCINNIQKEFQVNLRVLFLKRKLEKRETIHNPMHLLLSHSMCRTTGESGPASMGS